MEHLESCPHCGGAWGRTVVSGGRDLLLGIGPGSYDLRECAACGLVTVDPRPEAERVHDLYSGGAYYPTGGSGWRAPVGFLAGPAAWLRKSARTIATLPYRVRFGAPTTAFPPSGQGRLFEIGFGGGEYLVQMRSLGWEVHGCELDARKVSHARSELWLENVHHGRCEDLRYPPGHFDAIVMWHVLEHVHDPRALLARVFQMLKPGGRLALSTPNANCAEARLLGRWWIGYEIPRHLTLFNVETLRKLLNDCGFEIGRVRPSLWAASLPDSISLLVSDLTGCSIWGTRLHRMLYYGLFPLSVLWCVAGNWAVVEVAASKAVEPAAGRTRA